MALGLPVLAQSSILSGSQRLPDYAAAGFIPEIWSGKLIEKFYAATVLAAISNTPTTKAKSKAAGDRPAIRTKPTPRSTTTLSMAIWALQRPREPRSSLPSTKASTSRRSSMT